VIDLDEQSVAIVRIDRVAAVRDIGRGRRGRGGRRLVVSWWSPSSRRGDPIRKRVGTCPDGIADSPSGTPR
jgi:hypothetical protein